MKVIIDCVFGNVCPEDAMPTESAEVYGCEACEYIQENKVHRCCKFICVAGRTPAGEDVDEWRCSEAWIPVLLVENAMTNRGTTASIDKMINEVTTRQDSFNQMLEKASGQKMID